MTVQNNVSAMNTYQLMLQKKKQEEESMEKLSSGFQINNAGDDAAGLAISEKMRAQIAIYDQAQQNAKDGQNMVKTAEGAMQEVHTMLNRASELATQASNGTYTDAERGMIQSEIDSIASEVDRIAKSTNFNGISLLDGSNSSIDIQLGDGSAVSASIEGLSDIAASLSNVSVGTHVTASDAVAAIQASIDFVSGERGTLGATENRLVHSGKALSFSEENLQRAEAEIRDTNMAKEASNLNQQSVGMKTILAMMEKNNENSNSLLGLLGK